MVACCKRLCALLAADYRLEKAVVGHTPLGLIAVQPSVVTRDVVNKCSDELAHQLVVLAGEYLVSVLHTTGFRERGALGKEWKRGPG